MEEVKEVTIGPRPTARKEGDPDRVTAKLQVYFEHCCVDPVTVDRTFQDILETTEQPYYRRLSVGLTWQSLDIGWLEEVGFLALENISSTGKRVIPTPEEKEELRKRVLLLSYTPELPKKGFKVRPGKFMFFEAEDAKGLFLRAAEGKVDIQIWIFPK